MRQSRICSIETLRSTRTTGRYEKEKEKCARVRASRLELKLNNFFDEIEIVIVAR